MELFLNLCWIALLLPAYTLWRQRASSGRSVRGSVVFICAVGCLLVLLFPVISASDDLHSIGQAMEEAKRTLRHGGRSGHGNHSDAHAPQAALCASVTASEYHEQSGVVIALAPKPIRKHYAFSFEERGPPAHPAAL